MKKIVILIIFLIVMVNLEGQSPQKMSYQCIVRNNNNLVMNQPVGMRISILQSSPTGSVIYQEIYNPNPITNINGLVTLEIGTGIPITGTFSAINWGAGPFFLRTETDPAGGTNYIVSGTTQLLSVPFALFANTAGNGFSGNYNDLINRPLLFDGTWSSLTGKPAFSTVAISGSYNDLFNKPVLFTGNYNDLTNKPVLFNGAFASLTGKPTTVSGYGITDAMTIAHAANSVTTGLITNWNTAFGWGNHATAGYVAGTRTITINGTTLNLSANNTWNVGTVTSVGLSLPGIFTVSGSPVTSLGTLSATLASQTANLVFASPNGAPGSPAFRALLSADLPNLDWSKITTGKPTTLSGYGITDAMNTSHPANSISAANITNWTSAFGWGDHSLAGYAKYPSQTGNSGKYLTTNGTITSWASLATVAVTGSYNDLINKPTFDGTFVSLTGKPTTVAGYGINDAMTTAHVANSITSGLITNWNTAYGWGNHASVGYVPGTRTITINGTTLNLTANNTWNVGTVTSVGMSLPSIFSVAGSPVTSLGTLSATLASQTANLIFASPNGTAGAPVFRALINADIPNLDWGKISTGKPTTLAGYGITDAISASGNQTFTGIITFSKDIVVNGLTVGKGQGAISGNTAFGNSALSANTTGDINTAFGKSALSANTTGRHNTALGSGALKFSTTGTSNTATGSSALVSNTIGNQNTANGAFALQWNTEGILNTAIGYMALYNNTIGVRNTALGAFVLENNTTGEGNTAVGIQALSVNTTGNYNTATGWLTLDGNTTGNGNAAYGSTALYLNTTGYSNVAIGGSTCYNNTTGYHNTGVGVLALYANASGDHNTAIGSNADTQVDGLTNATAIGYNAKVNASNKVRIGNANITVIEGQVNWSVGSDRRLKENIEYSDKLGLEFVNRLKTVTFTYKNDSTKRHHDGLIAQDVEETLNQLDINFSGIAENENNEKTLNLSYAEFVIPLINAVKELNKQSQVQQKQIDELKQMVNNLIQK